MNHTIFFGEKSLITGIIRPYAQSA